jgi:hypothetical protein
MNDLKTLFRSLAFLSLGFLFVGVGVALLYLGYGQLTSADLLDPVLRFVVGIAFILYGFCLPLRMLLPGREPLGGSETSASPPSERELRGTVDPVPTAGMEPERTPTVSLLTDPKTLTHCPACGSPIESAGKFCGNCGKVLK